MKEDTVSLPGDTTKEPEPSDKDTRRKALRTLITSAAIAGSASGTMAWKKLLARSILIPVHAATTGPDGKNLPPE